MTFKPFKIVIRRYILSRHVASYVWYGLLRYSMMEGIPQCNFEKIRGASISTWEFVWNCNNSGIENRRYCLRQSQLMSVFPIGHHCALLGLLIFSTKLISGMKVEEHEEKLKPAIAKMFSVMHKSVSEYSQKMLDELKRHNYVTPTNYLELVSGYKS